MAITAHCLVKNEDRWVWFALQSVIDYVDQIIVFDTGSTDDTTKLVQGINNKKILFEKKGEISKSGLVKLRHEMIERTKTEWFLILDGDEIWPDSSIKALVGKTSSVSDHTVGFITPVRNCIGDVFHFLPPSSGRYEIAGFKGNLNIRLIKKTKSLMVGGEYPLEYYSDKNGPIQNQANNLIYTNDWMLHTSFLERSSQIKQKVSGSFGRQKIWEKGIEMDKKELPKVFFLGHPKALNDPLKKRGFIYEAVSAIVEPLIVLKRLL